MKLKILEIDDRYHDMVLPAEVLTLKPFLDYVDKIYKNSNPNKQKVLSYVREKFHKHPELTGNIALEKIHDFEGILQMIYATTSPILEEEQFHFWALCLPIKPIVFYCTDAFFSVVANEQTGEPKKNYIALQEHDKHLNSKHLESCYSLVLEQCYHMETEFLQEIIYPFLSDPDGLTRYFKISFDTRFIRVFCNGPLPPFSIDTTNYNREQLLDILEEKLPLSLFRFEGIGIMTVSDVTPQYAVETIKKSLLFTDSVHPEEYYPEIVKSLKTLARSKEIEFGLFPLLTVNNKYIFQKQSCCNSLLMHMFEQQGMEHESYYFFGDDYLKDPKLVFLREIPDADASNVVCVNTLKGKKVQSYAIIPIHFNNKLCGVLEIYTKTEGLLNEDILPRVEPALPYIAQIFQKNIDDFDNEIDLVIKKNFTSVQPAVQWKFIDAAWHYIRDHHNKPGNGRREIEDVAFENVYPLYGAVDLRNSTIERNEALRKDLLIEFNVLISVLEQLKAKSGFGLIDEKIFTCKKWLGKISNLDGFNQESRINEFLETDIAPFLKDFIADDPVYTKIAERYFEAVHAVTGPANENRRMLESSMSTVVSAVNNYMEMLKDEMQKAYPCYFEKFKTDGVEYDVYIGQSLAPQKPFKEIYLSNLRLMQLTSMAAIAKYTHSLQGELKIPMETTQLIFIHSYPIEIKFRKDEKRFDVEGAYNIRYQVVKKRIDKVHIRGTRERLTVPNKIALVYFNQKEADEYAGYIKYLEEKGVLANDMEYLELEQLQGISGLKALRVSVMLE